MHYDSAKCVNNNICKSISKIQTITYQLLIAGMSGQYCSRIQITVTMHFIGLAKFSNFAKQHSFLLQFSFCNQLSWYIYTNAATSSSVKSQLGWSFPFLFVELGPFRPNVVTNGSETKMSRTHTLLSCRIKNFIENLCCSSKHRAWSTWP